MHEQSRLDETTYESSRLFLRAALEHLLEAGRSVRELSEFALDKFGTDFLPYLRQFLHEVGQGRVSVSGLSPDVRMALAGHSISSEERERMIREAAYLRAERRGFCGGSAEQDWIEAEHEIDLCLAQGPGMVVRGGRTLDAVVAAMQQELEASQQVVARWLDGKFPAMGSGAGKKTAARAARAGGKAAVAATPAAKRAVVKKQAPGRPAAAQQPVAKKSVAKKTAAKKTVAKKTATKKTVARKTAGKRAVKKTPPAGSEPTPSAGKTATRRKSAKKQRPAAAAAGKKKTAAKPRTSGGRAVRRTRRGSAG